jgi:hypothetical protein
MTPPAATVLSHALTQSRLAAGILPSSQPTRRLSGRNSASRVQQTDSSAHFPLPRGELTDL